MIGIIFLIFFIIMVLIYSAFVMCGDFIFETENFKAIWNICGFIISIATSLEIIEILM